MKHKGITRRDFLKGSTSAALAGAFYLSLPGKLSAQPGDKTRVILIREQAVLDKLNKPDDAVLARMLDEAVTILLGEKDPLVAWKRLVKPDDVVGIKTNIWSYLPVPPGLEQAIYARLIDAGVVKKNISMRDRSLLADNVFKRATALINVRPMRTHDWSGVGTLIKNYITFTNNPSSYHPDTCADLATIWKLPLVKGKTRLNILVMLTPLFHGSGPHHFNPKYTWAYKGLLVGTDPVAVDATGLRILQAKRREFFGEDRPMDPPPKHILLADTRHGLGTADPEKIELVKLGWRKDILI
ncbi:MAG: DUF362 domain-containing protein [Fidelibacterota bacterium]|nr:MAG: DUF362 domain-containing protein [Candidatus Neomarinimicrobiota bacterium]